MGFKLADVTDEATYREWQTHEVTDQTRGYDQESIAAMLVHYIQIRKARLKHPGSGLSLLDLRAGLAKVDDPQIRARALEYVTRDDEPVLVEDIPEVQKLIAEAHEAQDHLVRWRGHWTSRETLMRVLDDTRGIRAIAKGAGNKKRHKPYLTGVGAANRGFCATCAQRVEAGMVWRIQGRQELWHEDCYRPL
jgi:hypothetical protein